MTLVPERRIAKWVAQMPWEDRLGGRYYYRAKKINGRVVKEYFGSGHKAEAAAAEDLRTREAREADRKATAERLSVLEEKWAEPLDQFSSLVTVCEALVAGTLLGEGFHQHDRGAWRRRRMSPTTEGTASVPKAIPTIPSSPDLTRENVGEVVVDLLKRSRTGDNTASEYLASMARNETLLWELLTGLAREARATWIALLTPSGDGGALDREGLKHQLAQLRSDLAAAGSDPLEALVIERILVAWMAANHADIQLARTLKAGGTVRELEFLERQQERMQRNLLRATQSLATLRRTRSTAVQINVAEQQINLAG